MKRVIKRDYKERGKNKNLAKRDFIKAWEIFFKYKKRINTTKFLKTITVENKSEINYPESNNVNQYDYAETIVEEEPLSLLEKEIEMIRLALKRSNGKRKSAADELGISERTLYRKIKQFDLQDNEDE